MFCRSEERNQALRLCGWPHDTENSTLGNLLDKLQIDGQVPRAAALSVFHMKIRKAIKILTRSGVQKNDVSYQLVALALAGNVCLFFNHNISYYPFCVRLYRQPRRSVARNVQRPAHNSLRSLPARCVRIPDQSFGEIRFRYGNKAHVSPPIQN